MTYGQVTDAALKLINQYSIAGGTIPPAYNNQEDYRIRAPELITDAQMMIATQVLPIPAAVSTDTLESRVVDGNILYTAPHDFFRFRGSGLLFLGGASAVTVPVKAWLGDKTFIAPDDRRYLLEYYRYPIIPKMGTLDYTFPLDNTPAVHRAIPYYVAAQLAMGDDAFVYSSLYNLWETHVERLSQSQRVYATSVDIEDVYATDSYVWGY